MTPLMTDATRLLGAMTATAKPPSDDITRLLDALTALVRRWEERCEADRTPQGDPRSPVHAEQRAWARARSNDAMELTRLIAEYRRAKKNPALAGSVSPLHADCESA
jgi:hypothetical protein